MRNSYCLCDFESFPFSVRQSTYLLEVILAESNEWTFHALYNEMLNVQFLLLSSLVKAFFGHLLCFIC